MTTKQNITEAAYAAKQAAQAMTQYFIARSDEQNALKRKESAALILKPYLAQTHETLEYEGLTARLVTRETSGQMDWKYIPDAAILELARAGALHPASGAALASLAKALPAIHDILKKWQLPGGQTESLEVKAT